MKTFKTFEELIEAWYSNKFEIFYENGQTKYEVRRIGSTIYCYDNVSNCGKGAVHNFELSKFYAIEKPEPEPEPEKTNIE